MLIEYGTKNNKINVTNKFKNIDTIPKTDIERYNIIKIDPCPNILKSIFINGIEYKSGTLINLNNISEIYYLEDIIKKFNISELYVSNSLKPLENRFLKLYNLKKYNNSNNNFILFGAYDDNDLNLIKKSHNNIFLILGGSDFRDIDKIKNCNSNINYISISNDIKNRLLTKNIQSILVRFSLVDKTIFKPINNVIKDSIYIYNGLEENDFTRKIYNNKIFNQVINKYSYLKFIKSSDLHKIPNDKMPDIYSRCFIGLRLTEHDGNANTVQEFEAMNIPIVHNQSDYGLKWKTVNDIYEHIDNHNNNHNNNIKSFSKRIEKYKNILFICGDYPGYGGAATNCYNLQKFYKKKHNTYGFYYNFEIGNNAKYETNDDYIITDLLNIKDIKFKPDLIILKSFINFNLKDLFKCPIYYLVGGIYKNSLNKYYYDINSLEEQNKYINYNVINQIKKSTLSFVNSSHTQEILNKYYNIKTELFFSSFIQFVDKTIEIDTNFENRTYDYGLIVSNFNRPIKNVPKSINFLKDKKNVILIGKNSSDYKKHGFTCIDLVNHDEMINYYKQIKYIVQDSFYESCSNVKIESMFYGCKTKPIIVVSSTQYPGFGGAATNAYNIIKYLRNFGFIVCGVFFDDKLDVNVDPENIGGIFLYKLKTINENFIREQVTNYLQGEPTICFAKNYTSPIECKKMFPNSKVYYLVSGINHQYIFYPNYSYEDIMKLNSVQPLQDEISCIERIDKVIFNSNQTMSFFNKFYNNYKYKFINKIIDTSFIGINNLSTKNSTINRKYDIIICCSKLDRTDKNNLMLIPILINPIFNKYKKIIIGKNNDKFKCIPNSFFIEQLSNIEVNYIFSQSRVLLYPSLCEANSNTIREALNNSCCPLISINCGFSHIYPNCCVCNTYDNSEWTNKLIYLLQNNYICDKTIYNIYSHNLIKII